MLEISCNLNFEQLFKIARELKRYFWQKLKLEKTQNLSKTTTKNKLVLQGRIVVVIIDNHMAIIQIQIGKNTIEDVLLDGGFRINIITKQLRLRLGLPKPKHVPYNMRMANQTTKKPMGFIRALKMYVHNIPYVTMFIVLQNNVVDFSYSMLLGRPWLRDAKMAHDWGKNIVTIQGNETIKTIIVTKCLGGEVRNLEALLCYDYQNGITNEKEDITFAIEPKLFSIGIISLLETIQFVKTTYVEIMDINVKTSNLELN